MNIVDLFLQKKDKANLYLLDVLGGFLIVFLIYMYINIRRKYTSKEIFN